MPTINLDDIKIWEDNYNLGDTESIALSIRRFGYGGAVKLWKNNECRGGNHTVMALRLIKELGPDDEYDQQWPPTNVMVEGDDWHILYSDMSHLSEAEALAYAISDNRQAERASKDEGLLLEYLEALRDEDMTMVIASGFDDGDMGQIAEFLSYRGQFPQQVELKIELVLINELQSHPRNYRNHPEDQLQEIAHSIQQHGFYSNIVISQDNYILRGHGLTLAAQSLGLLRIPAIRVPIAFDHPQALKILVGDNELSHLAEIDDRQRAEILKEIKDAAEDNLLGTGFDEQMLANLVYVTRPIEEVGDFNAAAHWVGLPEYTEIPPTVKLVVNFRNDKDREAFAQKFADIEVNNRTGVTWSMWWPKRERDDLRNVRFEDESRD